MTKPVEKGNCPEAVRSLQYQLKQKCKRVEELESTCRSLSEVISNQEQELKKVLYEIRTLNQLVGAKDKTILLYEELMRESQ